MSKATRPNSWLRWRRQPGYLLVELLVSLVIVATGILFLVDSMRGPLTVSQQLLETDQAVAIAAEVFDRLMREENVLDSLAVGSRAVKGIVYEWRISEERPVQRTELATPVSLLSITIGWESEKKLSLRFPFLWAYSPESPAPAASH